MFFERLRRRESAAVLAAVASLSVAACGGNNKANSASTRAEVATNSNGQPIQIAFDYLGGGSKVIRVYAGPGSETGDKQTIGTYFDGDTAPAECKTEGRTVFSHPELGEEKRNSNKWIRIQGPGGETEYATAVYIERPQEVLNELPDC
jgi:hypothetical protein